MRPSRSRTEDRHSILVAVPANLRDERPKELKFRLGGREAIEIFFRQTLAHRSPRSFRLERDIVTNPRRKGFLDSVLGCASPQPISPQGGTRCHWFGSSPIAPPMRRALHLDYALTLARASGRPIRAYVFGSLATSTATTASDLNICVVYDSVDSLRRGKREFHEYRGRSLASGETKLAVGALFFTVEGFKSALSKGGVCEIIVREGLPLESEDGT